MLKLYVPFLMARLLKQQSIFPGEIRKSKTDRSLLGMMQVQWSQEGWTKVCPAKLGSQRRAGSPAVSEGLAHPDR